MLQKVRMATIIRATRATPTRNHGSETDLCSEMHMKSNGEKCHCRPPSIDNHREAKLATKIDEMFEDRHRVQLPRATSPTSTQARHSKVLEQQFFRCKRSKKLSHLPFQFQKKQKTLQKIKWLHRTARGFT